MIRKISFILLCLTLTNATAFADISGFVFITPAQTILPNTLSGPITIQAQNSSGTQEATTETTDLTFVSTSPTGQFLSSTGKAVSKTMAKGTSNRTFYYSDSTLGTYTLTVTAIGRTSKQTFSTTQQITVASTLPPKPKPVVKTSVKTAATVPAKTKTSKSSAVSAKTNTSPEATLPQSETPDASSTNTATVYEGVKQTSMFDPLFDWPGKFWHWLVHIF